MIALAVALAAEPAAAEPPSPGLVGEEALVGGTAFALAVDVAAGGDAGLGLLGWVPVGAGLGAGTGWALRRRAGWDEGQVMAFTTTQLVVAGHGLGLGYVGELDRGAGWLGLGGLGVGSLVGAQLTRLEPHAGDVAVVRAGMLWGGLAGIAAGFVDPHSERRDEVASVVVGTDLGLLAGLLVVAQRGRPTRGQVAEAQLFGLGGATAGLAVGLGLQGAELGRRRTPFAGAALGGAVGLAYGAFGRRRSRGLVRDRGHGAVVVGPTPGGEGATVSWTGLL